MDERRAVVRREHHRVAADDDVALGIARVLHILRRRGGAELSRQTARKAHPLALDVAAGAAKELERAGKVAKLDADFLQQRVGVALDRRETLFAEHFGQRDLAGDVGDRRVRTLGARRSARLAAASRLPGGGRCGSDMAFSPFPTQFILPVRPGPCASAPGDLNPKIEAAPACMQRIAPRRHHRCLVSPVRRDIKGRVRGRQGIAAPDHVGRLLADHDRRRVEIAVGDRRHDRGIDDAQRLDADHPRLGIDDGERIVGRSHLAGAATDGRRSRRVRARRRRSPRR